MGSGTGIHPDVLLQRARDGGTTALGRLLEVYRAYLTLFSRLQIDRRLQSKVNPSDLVQETFLQAQRAFGQFRGTTEGEFLQWLRRILVSRLAKQVRRFYGTQRRDLNLERRLDEEWDRSSQAAQLLAVSQSSPSHRASWREQAVLVANALDALPEDYREVIIMRNFQELSFVEVAERMGRSEDSVKKIWARALVALRNSLEEIADDSI